jgi:ribonuclease VapC
MIIDSSALVAVVRNEAGADRFFHALSDPGEPKRMSAANYLEAAIVIDGSRSPIASRGFDDAVAAAAIIVEPVTREQAEIARAAYRDFGKGSGHPAGLNFGDCFAYALAKSMREPLLFKGDDFSHTDVAIA